MATSFLTLVNGVPRSAIPSGASTVIYDQSVSIVSSGATPPSSLTGPVTAGTSITLPSSGSYTLNVNSIANIQIYLNGDRLEQVFDWSTAGSGPNYTAFQLTFDLVVGDRLDIRSERS